MISTLRNPKGSKKRIACAEPRLRFDGKADDGTPGWIEGYASVFGNIDLVGDRVMRGAFAKSIERVKAGKVPLMCTHAAYGGDTLEIIGKLVDAREDHYGLWIKAEYSAVQVAQDVRQKVNEGMIQGLSIGYKVVRYEPVNEDGRLIFELKELQLLEVTVTAFPANELAGITAGKTDTNGGHDPLGHAAGLNVEADKSTSQDAAGKASPSASTSQDAALSGMDEILRRNTVRLAKASQGCAYHELEGTAGQAGGHHRRA